MVLIRIFPKRGCRAKEPVKHAPYMRVGINSPVGKKRKYA
jgi:hypothetical protein